MPDDTTLPPDSDESIEILDGSPTNVVDIARIRGKRKNDKTFTSMSGIRRAAQELYNAYRRQLLGGADPIDLKPEEVRALSHIIDLNRKVFVEAELEKRVEELERTMKGAKA